MLNRFVLALIVALAGCASAHAALTADSSVDDVLDALDQRGHDLKTLTANVSTADVDMNMGEIGSILSGRLVYQDLGQSNARFRVTFDKKTTGNQVKPIKHDYLYTDGKVTDRDYSLKQQDTKQVLKPGEKMELFKLNGPFPLPLGQSKDEVHKTFEVTKEKTTSDDPKDSIHLKLIPHAGTEIGRQFSSIDISVDPVTSLPVRVKSIDTSKQTEKVTDLSDVKLNVPVKDADFELEHIDLGGWNAKSE